MNREIFGTFDGNTVNRCEGRAIARTSGPVGKTVTTLTDFARVGHSYRLSDLIFGAII